VVDRLISPGESCLHLASLYASQRAMRVLLADERGKKLLNSKNKFKETPLHLVAGSGDKGATAAAKLLLQAGASLLEQDQWGRGPLDVSHDNAENSLVQVFEEFLDTQPEEMQKKVASISKAYKDYKSEDMDGGPKQVKVLPPAGLLGAALKGLKKTTTVEKTMFSKMEGKITDAKTAGKDAKSTGKVLSKMVDFPGDIEEVQKHLADDQVDPGGKDAYSLTALHKFASWNKVDLLDVLLPKLTKEQINEQDRDGKTALHWAVEMASVAAIKRLRNEVDRNIKDNKGRTCADLLKGQEGTVIGRIKKALEE